MRIQDRSSLSPSAAETNRSTETQKNGRENAQASGPLSAEGDRVELSSTLGQLAHAITAHNTERSNRVQSLAGDYQSGRYHANAEATSRAMVTDALAPAG